LCNLTGAVPETLIRTVRLLLRAGIVTAERLRGQQYYSLAPRTEPTVIAKEVR
jgi:DNA-binding transcriptional ArsR family regulator